MTRDEAERLPAAIASLPPGMPALVLDSGSSDDTVAVARRLGARVIERAWEGFISARRFALDAAATEWVLMLDADERLDPQLRRALEAFEPAEGVHAYAVRRATMFCGRAVRACGWSDEPIVRVVRRGGVRLEARPAAGGDAALHERWVSDGETATLPGTLVHDSYPSRARYRAKFARYTSIEAASLRTSRVRGALQMPIAVLRFAYWMVKFEAWRDGWRGWYVTFFSALYPLAVHWKALRRA